MTENIPKYKWLSNQSALYGPFVFILWTVTSFLCHYCAKLYLEVPERGVSIASPNILERIYRACTITAVQLALCLLLVDMTKLESGRALRTVQLTHALATLATNLSMSLMFASSTFAIKMMEPITSAVTQYVMLGTPLSPLTIVSLPVIVGGAIVFSGNPLADIRLSYGIIAAFASNIILGVRNVVLKGTKSDHQQVTTMRFPLLKETLCATCFACSLALLHFLKVVTSSQMFGVSMALLSGVFHVSYSFVSTGLVLSHLSVVSHAVANILKRGLVVLLLYVMGKRVATAYNFLGLAICTLGLLLYVYERTRKTQSQSLQSDNGMPAATKRVFKYLIIVTFFVCFLAARHGMDMSQVRLRFESESVFSCGFPAERLDHTFTHKAHTKLTNMEPDLSGYLSNQSSHIQAFLRKPLLQNPIIANELSHRLKTHVEIIKEAQRVHFNMLEDILKKYKYAILLEIAAFENKGDPCITVGEIYFLARMHLDVLYYCDFATCHNEQNLLKAQKLVSKYNTTELVILAHGGGNLVLYTDSDRLRFKFMELFVGYHMLIFPQSLWVNSVEKPHFKECVERYCCNENITMVLRDRQSYDIARRYFNGTSRLLLAPDMAFQIGPVDRFISPVFDVMWNKRTDKEAPSYGKIPHYPPGLRVHVSDWRSWITPRGGSDLETAFYVCTNGFFYLQRGRVVVTDRLHGHILATLMNIPHVLIDNSARKLSSYHHTWTKSLENTLVTSNPQEAMDLAIGLLKKYNHTLPPRVPFLNLSGDFKIVNFSRPDQSFT